MTNVAMMYCKSYSSNLWFSTLYLICIFTISRKFVRDMYVVFVPIGSLTPCMLHYHPNGRSLDHLKKLWIENTALNIIIIIIILIIIIIIII